MKIKESFIKKSVNDYKCPALYFCTVATTCYEKHEREEICLECWLDYCKRNNIEIDYEEVIL